MQSIYAAVRAETLAILGAGRYTVNGRSVDLRQPLLHAVRNTGCYLTAPPLLGGCQPAPRFQVTDEKTHWAVARLARERDDDASDTALLNFANGCTPGGGYLRDCAAQEEDLCRSSGLYSCLLADGAAPFYRDNRRAPGHSGVQWYTDAVVYSPRVPFFRGAQFDGLLDRLLLPSVLTCAAPMLSCPPPSHDHYRRTLVARINAILSVAAAYGHRTLVLGAWGCGAFGNDPDRVADAFAHCLAPPSPFHTVVFACHGPERNLAAFASLFPSKPIAHAIG